MRTSVVLLLSVVAILAFFTLSSEAKSLESRLAALNPAPAAGKAAPLKNARCPEVQILRDELAAAKEELRFTKNLLNAASKKYKFNVLPFPGAKPKPAPAPKPKPTPAPAPAPVVVPAPAPTPAPVTPTPAPVQRVADPSCAGEPGWTAERGCPSNNPYCKSLSGASGGYCGN